MLRSLLEDITETLPASRHARAFQELAERHPHSLEPQPVDGPGDFNCFGFAFELWRSAEYRAIAQLDDGQFFANSDFVDCLLREDALQARSGPPLPGDVVVYLADGWPRHAGRFAPDGNRVVSKWGLGLLLSHDPWDVPARYGDDCRCFAPVTEAEALRLLRDYLRRDPEFAVLASEAGLRA